MDTVGPLAPVTVTAHGGDGVHATAIPRLLPSRPNSPITKQSVASSDFARGTGAAKPLDPPRRRPGSPGSVNRPEIDNLPESGGSPGQQSPNGSTPVIPTKIEPTAVFMVGNTKVTVSAFSDSDSLLFGTQTLRAEGAPLTIAGQIVSFGPGGHVHIGTQTFDIPVPTKLLQNNGQLTDSWILSPLPKTAGVRGQDSGASIYHIDEDPSGFVGSTLFAPTSRTGTSGSATPILTGAKEKKSGAGRLAGSITNVMLLLGSVTIVVLLSPSV